MNDHEIKARALILSFQLLVKDFEIAKQCALILANEMIEQQQQQADTMNWSCVCYWEEVKQSIMEV